MDKPKKILVTGAKGMLGSDLCPYLANKGFEVIATDYDNLDITNKDMVFEVFRNQKPDLIIHCAAYTNVDGAESDIEGARKLNYEGTKNVALASKDIDAALLILSTDYVFDGLKTTPYKVTDIPKNPKTVYGQTKLEAENAVKEICEKYYIVRTSWLYGIHGKNFVETMLALSDKPELKVVDDQVGCPTSTMELIQGILKVIEKPYGIYHVCGSNETSWYGFALEIFKQAGLKVNVKPCTTEEFPRPAPRPHYSTMDNTVDNIPLCKDWKEALSDYLKSRK